MNSIYKKSSSEIGSFYQQKPQNINQTNKPLIKDSNNQNDYCYLDKSIPLQQVSSQKSNGKYNYKSILSRSGSNQYIRQKGKIRNGIVNLGNTCYMNSVLQQLFNLPKFKNVFSNKEEEIGNRVKNGRKNYGISLYLCILIDLDDFLTYNEILEFKNIIDEALPQLEGFQQQDAQEFMISILQCVHEELNKSDDSRKYRRLDTVDMNQNLNKQAEEWWQYFKRRDDSEITDMFGGQFINRIRCINQMCRKENVSFDNFRDVSLPLIDEYDRLISMVDLRQLIEMFCNYQQKLEGYKCDKCKQENSCRRIVQFQKLPEILVFTFKRFGNYQMNKKLDTKISFPDLLDMSTIVNSKQQGYGFKQHYYKLSGYILHHGSEIQSGHYTSNVKNFETNQWLQYNDDKVSELNKQHLYEKQGSDEVYMVFYINVEKQNQQKTQILKIDKI